MKKNVVLILVLFLSKIEIINAQIVTDRPDQTESSSTIPRGALQIESGVLLQYEGETLTERQILFPTNLLRYGITRVFELRVLNQIEMLSTNNSNLQGISDLEIGTKIQLLKTENINTEIAFISHLKLPTGNQELTDDFYSSSNKISISHALKENFTLGYNIGYNFFGNGNREINYSFAFGTEINNKIGIYFEPYGGILNFDSFVSKVDGGLTYLVNPNLQLDFSFGTGLSQKMNYVSFGCSWLFEKN